MKIFDTANILLPDNSDMKKWSVIACDQHTSDIQYWDKVKEEVSVFNSTFYLIVPEAFLHHESEILIKNSNLKMKEYLEKNIFKEYKNSIIYVERQLTNGKVRQGVVGKIDLEYYAENCSNNAYIKPSEEIVQNRIPIRIDIRNGASLDVSHVILFCNDDKKQIIEPLKDYVKESEKVYDFDLMLNGGNIKGYLLNDNLTQDLVSKINANILLNNGLIVADGNHSLIAAKRVYEKYKIDHKDYLSSPLRYAMVEVVNIFNDAIQIAPIHRVIKNTNIDKLISEFKKKFQICGQNKFSQSIEIISKGSKEKLLLNIKGSNLLVQEVESFLDDFLKNNDGEIDYIHEVDKLESLCSNNNVVGFKFNSINKAAILENVRKKEVFPRKTFSIGASNDKRYYVECRKL